MSGEVVHLIDRRNGLRVVVTFRLSRAAFRHLAGALGSDATLVDIKESDGSEEIVLVPSSSRQLIGKLAVAFPSARVVVVEVEDPAYGVELGGQVMRSLDAGAEHYVVARSMDELASIVDSVATVEQNEAARAQEALHAGSDDSLSEILDDILRQRGLAEPAQIEVNEAQDSAD